MRKRKYLIGLAAGAVLSVSVAGVAHAALVYQSQSLVVTPSAGKLDKKKVGPLNSFFTDVITNYTDTGPGAPDRFATRTRVYFPKDFVFNVKGLATCEPTPAFTNGTTANAVATCPQAIVSTPDHTNTNKATLKVGGLPDVPATVTAFNGTPAGGFPRILLHSQTPAANRTLIGTLKPSDTPGYGKMLDVPVDLGPFQGSAAISDFRVTIGKVKLPKGKSAASAAKKKKKPQQYYISAKCSKKKWTFQATTTYNVGADSVATSESACKQKKAKKKKK
jgi:hypothetical protein